MDYLKTGGLFLVLGLGVYLSGLIILEIKKEISEEFDMDLSSQDASLSFQ